MNRDLLTFKLNLIDNWLRKSPPYNAYIERMSKALKGSAQSYSVGVIDKSDPLFQLSKTRDSIATLLNQILKSLIGFKFFETLVITFKKPRLNEEKEIEYTYKTAHLNSKAHTIINTVQVEKALGVSQETIMNVVGIWLSEGSGWVVESVDGHFINIVKYKPLRGSSYIELPKELRNPKKGLINLKNKDNECFRWCHVRHLNPQRIMSIGLKHQIGSI